MSREPLDTAPAERAARLAALKAVLAAGPAASSKAAQERAVSLGEPTLDRALGNLPTVAVHEVVPASGGEIAAATGFLLALALALKRDDEAADRPILWVTRPDGLQKAGALSGRGFVYLVAVVDWFSRKVLAWRLSVTLETEPCLQALNEAMNRFGGPRS